jgi:ribonuclease HI
MSSRKKLIIYTDGSYADGRSGWAFYISCNKDNTPWTLGYGNNTSNGSAQSEISACIEALKYLPEIEDKHLNDVEVIEIRSDYLELVHFVNKYFKPKFEYRLKEGKYPTYKDELLELLNVIKKLPVELQAKKVSIKDNNLLKVHKMAKYSLNELPENPNNFYMESSKYEGKKLINKKNNILNDTKEQKLFDKQNWFDYINAEIINLPVASIHIEEDIHLEAKSINFGRKMKEFKEDAMIDKPIAVRKIGENYVLIAGMSRLCAAKLLGFETIPTVIQDISHTEFLLKYVI